MQNRVRAIILVAVGLLLGGVVGLYFGWVVWPLEVTDGPPELLQENFRRDYTVMIAAAYWEDGDLQAARARLGSVDGTDPTGWLATLTVDYILSGRDEQEILFLVNLARDLGLDSPAMAPYLPRLESRNEQE